MHITIDISPLSSGHEYRGVGVYTKQLIEALKQYGKPHSYNFISRKQNLPKETNIVHYPYFDPFYLTLPLKKQFPTVVTIHDLIPLVYPDKFLPGIRGKIKWFIQKSSLGNTTRIITDSESSKRDIVRIAGVSEDKIDVVYLAPSPVYKPNIDVKAFTELKNRLKIPELYILYVGDVNWNKNISGLLAAFSKLVTRQPVTRNLYLLLVGKSFLNTTIPETQEINRTMSRLGIEDKIVRPGYVTDEELAMLYSHAKCLVEPSFYEGFGLPVLEAFACGCPVVVSDSSSLKEIAGPGMLVNAESNDSIAKGIQTVLEFPKEERENFIEKGHVWVKQFTWQRVAKGTIQSYEKTLG